MTNLLAKTANWKFILLSFLAFVICMYWFQTYESQMSAIAGEHTPLIDTRRNYDLEEIKDFIERFKGQVVVSDVVPDFAIKMLPVLLTIVLIVLIAPSLNSLM